MGDSSSVRFVLVLTRRLRPVLVAGVESIVADAAANRVVVAGTADAAALKARLEAKTKKAVEIISAGSGPKRPAPAAEPKDAGAGEKKADKDASPKEEKEKKQPPEEKKPKEVGTQQANAAHAIGSPLPCSQPLF